MMSKPSQTVYVTIVSSATILIALAMVMSYFPAENVSELDVPNILKVTTHPKNNLFAPISNSTFESTTAYVFDDYFEYNLSTDDHIYDSRSGFTLNLPENQFWTVYEGGCPDCELPTELSLPNPAFLYQLKSKYPNDVFSSMQIVIFTSSNNKLNLEENTKKIIKLFSENYRMTKHLDSDLEIYSFEYSECLDPCNSFIHAGFTKNNDVFITVMMFSSVILNENNNNQSIARSNVLESLTSLRIIS